MCVVCCVSVYVCGWHVIVNFLSCESFGSLSVCVCLMCVCVCVLGIGERKGR